MNWVLKIIINMAVIFVLLLALKSFMKNFVIKANGIFTVTLLLALLNWGLGGLLRIFSWPLNFITFYIFSFFVNWIIGIIVMKVTDKLTDALTIEKTSTLIFSGLFLAITNSVYAYAVGKIFN